MVQRVQIALDPSESRNIDAITLASAFKLGEKVERIFHVRVIKRSIDARSRRIKVLITADVFINEPYIAPAPVITPYKSLSRERSILIIGAGPAGLFAALRLLEHGIKPIVIERGKNVRERRRDLAAINKQQIVNPNSNYCFGEGGAGTYSDGKLYTRSNKRGDIQRILEVFVEHGADENILIDAHPHIGTNKLPKIISTMRDVILNHGGDIHYNTCVTDLIISGQAVKGVVTKNVSNDGTLSTDETSHYADAVILATGHSARDIFRLLRTKGIDIEPKPFAVGVRAEHPQALVDCIQYHCRETEHESVRRHLPAAAYSLVHQAKTRTGSRGVYSFCMCPGGIIAPCATEPNQVVTNGWSPSKRNNPFANSGIVVEVRAEDLQDFQQYDVLSGMMLQEMMETDAWKYGGETQVAPSQRITDFISGRVSNSLPECSYQPGIKPVDLNQMLPPFVSEALRQGFIAFGRKMRGYLSPEAIIVGVETRTSSPVRIPRDPKSLMHSTINNLYPAAEGAGYAGGIVSAAMDGRRIADAIAGM